MVDQKYAGEVDAEEFLGYLDGNPDGAPPLAQAMGHADPGGGEGGLPSMSEGGTAKTLDEQLLEALKGVQANTAQAIKILERKITEERR